MTAKMPAKIPGAPPGASHFTEKNMFTGLVAGLGEVARISKSGQEERLVIRPLVSFPSLVIGESIAVNGACLSVEAFDAATFTAYASAETLALTNLKDLKPGSRVNLERALALGDRLGGHLVSGHVDGLATVLDRSKAGSSQVFTIGFPEEFAAQVITKGSVALDGISLTINECGDNWLKVNIIPETQAQTTICDWTKGRKINFETDLLGKYVQRILQLNRKDQTPESRITESFLRSHGF